MGAFKESEVEKLENNMTCLKFLQTHQPVAEFLNDEGLRLSHIKSIKEEYVSATAKGHGLIKSRFKIIVVDFTDGHKMIIETDQAYSFFRSNIGTK